MATVDIDSEFINLFYGITDAKIPADINCYELKTQLANIVEMLQELNKNSKKPVRNEVIGADITDEDLNNTSVLVIDDLGVITYQLKTLLSQLEVDVDCSQEIYDAVNKFKKRKYDYIIMDLFIPTDREGFILLSEIKKMIQKDNLKTIVGVITASPKKEIEQNCKNLGADFFIEKNTQWQDKLYSIMDSYINVNEDDEV